MGDGAGGDRFEDNTMGKSLVIFITLFAMMIQHKKEKNYGI